MQQALQVCAYLVGVPLELMVIAALLRGEYRRYPFIFLYAVVDLLITILEIQPAITYSSATQAAKKQFAMMYWFNERIMQVLVFLLVISLVYRATRHMRPRRTLLTGTICGTVLVAAVSLWAHYDPNLPGLRYMTPWTRDLNFYAAILDLGLWVLLISSRQKDYKLLLVTGGLGIQFTGGAIGQALRDMSPVIVTAASDFLMIANLARIYIWWQAFRGQPKPLPSGNASPK
ncbi:MAG: hypothetical protein NTW28_20740 [Candidatus Solibacter sp.]|nr:hypothetical protein [Candidatus Solibacter sp.]